MASPTIIDFGFFTPVRGVADSVNESGQQWVRDLVRTCVALDDRGAFVSAVHGAWALADGEGRLSNVTRDPSIFVPNDCRVLAFDCDPSQIEAGMRVVGGELLPALPAPPPTLPPISDRQFFQALALPPFSIITPEEALDAVRTGEIPAVMQAVIDTLPAEGRFAATMLIAGGTEYRRDNPLVAVFGASRGMDDAAIDAFWRFAGSL